MNWGRFSTVFLFGVIGVAVIGYFVGLADGVPQPDGVDPLLTTEASEASDAEFNSKLISAVSYAEIPQTEIGPTAEYRLVAKSIPQQEGLELFSESEITPSAFDKEASSKVRASRRAFNGAPPIIPHAVQNTSDAACYACHGNGMQMAGIKASVMSHEFLANCTQCHASPAPAPFADVDYTVESDFVGLPAPKAGKRAFAGAPPTIPHSQWMRENCNACHSPNRGWAGMESTHPWRTNCTQCHAPSAALDQAAYAGTIPMLPPLEVSTE